MSRNQYRFNFCLPTLGGRQFWGDLIHCHGWRIQQHVVTGHCRLLDSRNMRRAWGTRAACAQVLERLIGSCGKRPAPSRAVILLHGILRSSRVMSRMAAGLHREDCAALALDYPSTRVRIEDSARYLGEVVASLDGVDRIDIVAHSLGGLVARCYLEQTALDPDPRLHRLVLLGVPNRGAGLANISQRHSLFRLLLGPAGQQLVDPPTGLLATLSTPRLEFAIVAGARGTPNGFNPLIPGDDDGIVSVASALLPGAADSLLVPCWHSWLPADVRVIAATRRFLETGCLHASGNRRPIPDHVPNATDSHLLE